MRTPLPFVLALAAPFSAFLGAQGPLPTLAAATRVVAAAPGDELDWPALLDRLAGNDAVFVGETHLDDVTHRVELEILQGLLAKKPGKVVLSLEMFERDEQPLLDAYLRGELDEAAFRERTSVWGNYATAYRPLIEAAKAAGIPVVAANLPRMLQHTLGRGGKQAFEALGKEQRALLPEAIYPASDAYWERVDRAVRGHMGGGGGSAEERLFDTQNLWDNCMGDSVAKAVAAHPGATVLHCVGGFHVAYRDGTVAQFVRRSPQSRFAVVEVSPVGALDLARPDRDAKTADYLVYAYAMARGLDDDLHAVGVTRELRYRLDVPGDKRGLPLLLWLPDRTTRAEDAFALWQARLGGEAALAVVEPPLPERCDDLAPGGAYVGGDGFRADYDSVQSGLARIAEYVCRHFGAERSRVVIAGEGAGGAVVLWSALYGSWLANDCIAIDPADLTRLSMEGLPDEKPEARSLHLVARTVDVARLERVAADYRKVGTETTVARIDDGGDGTAAIVREKLGLAAPPVVPSPAPLVLVLEHELPRARQWAELYAATLAASGTMAVLKTASAPTAGADLARTRTLAVGGDGSWPVSSFADGAGLPLAGGPFGGTTVVVLPKGIGAADRAAWLDLEQKKVIKKRSMFANIAIAMADGEPSLATVMGQLKAKGRSRVLIVPAVFCADAAAMQALQKDLGDAAQGMDLTWLPGLGGELVRGTR